MRTAEMERWQPGEEMVLSEACSKGSRLVFPRNGKCHVLLSSWWGYSGKGSGTACRNASMRSISGHYSLLWSCLLSSVHSSEFLLVLECSEFKPGQHQKRKKAWREFLAVSVEMFDAFTMKCWSPSVKVSPKICWRFLKNCDISVRITTWRLISLHPTHQTGMAVACVRKSLKTI